MHGARRLWRLPYPLADMHAAERGDGVDYRSERVAADGPPAVLEAGYGPSGPESYATPGTLEHFLTERYCLLQVRSGSPWTATRSSTSHAARTCSSGGRG